MELLSQNHASNNEHACAPPPSTTNQEKSTSSTSNSQDNYESSSLGIESTPFLISHEVEATIIAVNDGKRNEKSEIIECVDVEPGEKYTALDADALPDWRPKNLQLVFTVTSLFVLGITILYVILYIVSKSDRNYIAAKSVYSDWIFEFGPVFLALILAEILEQASLDLASLEPYMRLGRRKPRFNIRWNEHIAEPAVKKLLRSVLHLVVNLPCEARLHFASVFCALVIVPFQSALFDSGFRVTNVNEASFRVLGFETLASSITESVYPQLALKAIPENQDVNLFKWTTKLDRNSVFEPLYAATMPLEPEVSQEGDVYLNVTTSAVYSVLNCSIATNFTITASEVINNHTNRSATDVHIELTDEDGCTLAHDWDRLSLELDPGLRNPLLTNGDFALWRPIGSTNSTDGATEMNCGSDKYHVITGPLATSSSKDLTADGSDDSGWVALSCQALYYVLQDNVPFNNGDYSLNLSTSRPLQESVLQAIKRPVDENVLMNGLVYNITFPRNSYFWLEPATDSLTSESYRNLTTSTCDDGELPWGNERACQTFYNIADMWSTLAAVTAVSTAVMVTLDDWDIKNGTVTRTADGWYLSGFDLGYTIFMFAALLFFLGCEVKIRRNWFGLGRFYAPFLQEACAPSGVHSTPSSIAGTASLFRDRSMRDLFDGVDSQQENEALRTIRSRLPRHLVLRRWKIEKDGETQETAALIRPTKQPPPVGSKYGPAAIPSPDPFQPGLRHGTLPAVVKTSFVVFLATVVVIVVSFKYIVFGGKNSFQLWQQREVDSTTDAKNRDQLRALLQSTLFNGLPTFAIALAATFWSWVDLHHRKIAPFVGLSKGDVGKKTILLDYVHDYHFVVTWKALRNRHFKLAYITLITTGFQIATVFAAGIFVMSNGLCDKAEKGTFSQTWRDKTFQENNTVIYQNAIRAEVLTSRIFGFMSNITYQGVDLPYNGFFNVNIDAIYANMTCTPVKTDSRRNAVGWDAAIRENECNGATWANACALPQLRKETPSIPDGQCMAWKYLNSSDCPGFGLDDVGRWWLYGLNGVLEPNDEETGQTFADGSKSVSLLCTPNFWHEDLSILYSPSQRVVRKRGETIPIVNDRWRGSETNKSFTTWISELVNTTLAGNLQIITNTAYLDITSVITALTLNGVTSALFNYTHLADAASTTFESIFAVIAQLDQSGGSQQSLFLEETGNNPPSLDIWPRGEVAVFQKWPLGIGLVIMGVICLSIPLVWPRRKWRLPKNVQYPANVVSMIYDSSIMEMVDQGPNSNGRFPNLEQKRFKLGVYRGLSGKLRIGIEVEEKVDVEDN